MTQPPIIFRLSNVDRCENLDCSIRLPVSCVVNHQAAVTKPACTVRYVPSNVEAKSYVARIHDIISAEGKRGKTTGKTRDKINVTEK